MWLSTWLHNGTPAYAEHPTEQAAEAHAEMKRQGGVQATWFWSHITCGHLDPEGCGCDR